MPLILSVFRAARPNLGGERPPRAWQLLSMPEKSGP